MKRLFIDLDGTLSRFYEQAKCIERMREPHFFEHLAPYENAIQAIKNMKKDRIDDFDIFILSAISNNSEAKEKTGWVHRYLDKTVPVLFCRAGESKTDYVRRMDGSETLSTDDYLLDDYSRNLLDWQAKGGTPIKFRNELNGRGWNGIHFRGPTVYYDQKAEDMVHDLLTVTGLIREEKISPDLPVTPERLQAEIDRIMECQPGWRSEEGEWHSEIFADYRDELEEYVLREIFEAKDPRAAFYEKLGEWYDTQSQNMIDDVVRTVKNELGSLGGAFGIDCFGTFLDESTERLFQNIIDSGKFYVKYPENHYLNQKIKINIMIDTGDGSRDFRDNTVFPHWDADPDGDIRDTASIVWLARTQGVDKTDLKRALNKYLDDTGKTGFLETLGQELINMGSYMSVLTFLVEMTFGQALEIADSFLVSPTENDQREIIIKKNTITGLFDPWSGSGSLFEIELSNDVEIPIGIIRSAKPDGCDGSYSVSEVYGMCDSAWRETIHSMRLDANNAA